MKYAFPEAGSVGATLRSHGVIPTLQRLYIGQMVLTRATHFSAEQLYEEAKQAGACVSKATVYNTLGLFVEKGLLRQVLVDPSKVFYDSNMAPHHHFYDVETGELEDIDASEIRIGALPQPDEGRIEGVDVVVRIRRPGRQ
ncbi:MAG: Fur family transcriptional regulator [Arenicellales bacterium]